MKQDIREIFKKDVLPKKKLPDFHEDEFLGKLENFNKKEKSKLLMQIFKIAASILLLVSCGYIFKNTYSNPTKTASEIQIIAIEKEYLNSINKEWNTFTEITNDTILIRKYKNKLKAADVDYKKITTQLKELPNNINVLESLIANLQRRLQLIKDINEHINELNQKNTSNETIYL
mgnify:CR=1 FL=1